MRLFAAILFDDATTSNLVALQDDLRQRCGDGNYSRPVNLHLTLAFLDECDQGETKAAIGALQDVDFAAFTLVIDGVGLLSQHGHTLGVAQVAQNGQLLTVRRLLTRALRQRGCDFDQHQFTPHITLARRLPPGTVPWSVEPFAQSVERIHLMVSERIGTVQGGSGDLSYRSICQQVAQIH